MRRGKFRDGLFLTVGILGIIHQTLGVEHAQTNLLILFATMAGLPAFLPDGLAQALLGNGRATEAPDESSPSSSSEPRRKRT